MGVVHAHGRRFGRVDTDTKKSLISGGTTPKRMHARTHTCKKTRTRTYDGNGEKIRLTFEASPPHQPFGLQIVQQIDMEINLLLPLVFSQHDHCPSYHTCISRATEYVIVGLRSHGFHNFLSLRTGTENTPGQHVASWSRVYSRENAVYHADGCSRRPRNHRHNCGVYAGGRRHDDVRSAANIPKRPRHRRDTPLLDIPRDLEAPPSDTAEETE